MNNIKKNYIYNVLYQILLIILPLITAPYVARILKAEGTGIYSYTHSIAQYFVLFIMLGLNNYGNRSIARVRDDQDKKNIVFSEIFCMQLMTGFLFLTLFIILQCLNFFSNTFYLWLQLPIIFAAIIDINWFFFGLEKFKITITRNVMIKILTVIAIFTLVKTEDDIYKYILIMSIGMFLSNACLIPFLIKEVDFKLPKMKNILYHYKENIILFIPVIATSIYTVMDKIMIGSLSGIIDVGYYEYAERIKNIPLGLVTALGTVMLPRMSNLFAKKDQKSKAHKYISQSMNFILWLSIALSFGITAISNEFIPIFLGDGYTECISLTNCLCFSIIFIAWASIIRTQYLIPNSKNKIYIMSTIIGAMVNVLINILLIPKYQAIGAVVGTMFAEFSVCLYQTLSVRKELHIIEYLKDGVIYLFAGILMLFILKIIEVLALPKMIILFLKVLSGIIIYLVLTIPFIVHNNLINIDKIKLK